MNTAWLYFSAAAAVLLALAIATGLGSRRRGHPVVVALVSAAVFPLSWSVWFVVDNLAAGRRPFRGH